MLHKPKLNYKLGPRGPLSTFKYSEMIFIVPWKGGLVQDAEMWIIAGAAVEDFWR